MCIRDRWYVNNGGLDGSYSGMGVNEYGWWKYDNGTVDFNYSGIALNDYGWWKFVNGSIDFGANGLDFDEATNTWWYFNGGAIDFAFDGMASVSYTHLSRHCTVRKESILQLKPESWEQPMMNTASARQSFLPKISKNSCPGISAKKKKRLFWCWGLAMLM